MVETDEEKAARLKKEEAEAKEAAAEAERKAKEREQRKEPKYSDDYVDRMIDKKYAAWKEEEAKKYGDLDKLKEKAEKLDKIEEGQKSDLDKLTDKLARAEKKAAELESKLEASKFDMQKITALLENGLPAEKIKTIPKLLKRMPSTTEEELKADIEDLKDFGVFEPVRVRDGSGNEGPATGNGTGAVNNKAAQGAGKRPPAQGKDKIRSFKRSELKDIDFYKEHRDEIMQASEAGLIINDQG